MNTLKLVSIATFASTSIFFTSCGEKKDAESGASAEAQEAEAPEQDHFDSLTDELILQINNLGDAFDSARDKASGEAFVKKLALIGDEIEAISARMEKLETPSDEDIARIQEKMQNSTKKFNDQFGSFFVRFMQNDELGENVGSAMTEFQKRMDKLPEFLGPGNNNNDTPAAEAPAPAEPAAE